MGINTTLTEEQIQNLTYDDIIRIVYFSHLREDWTQKQQEGMVHQLMRIMFRISNQYDIDLKESERLVLFYENDRL